MCPPQQRRRSERAVVVGLKSYVFPALIGLPALAAAQGGFLWTDVSEIQDLGIVRTSVAGLMDAITNGIEGFYYRPTVFAVHSINYFLFGSSSLAFRLTNLLIHLANVILLFHLLMRLRIDCDVIHATTALFAVHPLVVTAIAWASDRTDLLALCCLLLGMIATLRYSESGKWWDFGMISVAVTVGLGAKETCAVAGLISGMAALWQGMAQVRYRLGVAALAQGGIAVLWFSWRIATSIGVPMDSNQELAVFERIGLHATIHLGYVLELVAPHRLSVCDAINLPKSPWLPLCGEALLIAVLFVTVWKLRGKNRRVALLAALWSCATLLPTSGVVSLLHVRADRYLYCGLPGLILLVSVCLSSFIGSRYGGRWLTLIFASLYLAAIGNLIIRSQHFASNERLWTWEVTRNDDCLEGHSYLAREHYMALRLDEALYHADAALRQNDRLMAFVDRSRVRLYKALTLMAMGRPTEAAQILETLSATSENVRTRTEAAYQLGVMAIIQKNYQDAIRHLSLAIDMREELTPSLADALLLRSYAYAEEGQLAEAREDYLLLRSRLSSLKESPNRRLMLEAIEKVVNSK